MNEYNIIGEMPDHTLWFLHEFDTLKEATDILDNIVAATVFTPSIDNMEKISCKKLKNCFGVFLPQLDNVAFTEKQIENVVKGTVYEFVNAKFIAFYITDSDMIEYET